MRETRRKGSRRCGGCGWAIKHARRVIGRVRTTDDALDANLHSLHDDGQFTPRPPAYRHRVLIRRISPIAYRNPFTEHTASSAHVARPDCTYPRCRPASLRDCPHDRRLTRTVTNNTASDCADIMQVARSSLSFPAGSPPQSAMYAQSPHGQGLMAAPAGFNRSFSDMNGFQQHAMEKPQIYTVRTTTTTTTLPSHWHANKPRLFTQASQSTKWK